MSVDRRHFDLKAHSCRATYVIFAAIGMLPVFLALFAALRTSNGWKDFAIFLVLPSFLLLWVRAFKLEWVKRIKMLDDSYEIPAQVDLAGAAEMER